MVLAVGLIFAAIPSVFTIPSEAFLFRPAPYQQAMRSQQFYQRFPGWLAELVVEGDLQGMEGMPAALQNLHYEEYERMLAAVLPPEWAEAEVNAVIQNFWAYMNRETNELEVEIDLTEPKGRLTGPGSDTVVQTIMNTWPECTAVELQGILQDMEEGVAGSMPVCRPPLEYRPAFVETIRSGLQIFATMLPDRVSLVELLEIVEQTDEMRGTRFADIYQTYRTLRGVLRIAPLVMAFLMLLIGLAAFRAPRAMLMTWGGPLLVAGVIGMVIALALGLAGNLIAESLVRQLAITRPAGMYQALVGALRGVSNQFTLYASLSGLLMAVLGAGLLLFGRVFPGEPEYDEEIYQEEYPAHPYDNPVDYPPDYPPEYPAYFPPETPGVYDPGYPDEYPTIHPNNPEERGDGQPE